MLDWILHLDKSMGEFITMHGVWIYALLAGIVFGETGLVVLPFLPGDTLLFAAGSFAALGHMNIWLLMPLIVGAALLGNTVNALIARWIYQRYGDAIFSGRLKWLDADALNKTQLFYDKYGGLALVLARFIPVARTFAPFVAGIAQMPWARFQMYNLIGAVLWVCGLLWLGMLFGNVPWIRQYLNVIILCGIGAAALPALGGLLWKLFKR
jgi:membrane-associated protein